MCCSFVVAFVLFSTFHVNAFCPIDDVASVIEERLSSFLIKLANINPFNPTCDFNEHCNFSSKKDKSGDFTLQQCPLLLFTSDLIRFNTSNGSFHYLVSLTDEKSFKLCNVSLNFSNLLIENSTVPAKDILQTGDNYLIFLTKDSEEDLCLQGAKIQITVIDMKCVHRGIICSGHGLCNIVNRTLQCYCDVSWTGQFCETSLLFENYNLNAIGSGSFLKLTEDCLFADCDKEGTLKCIDQGVFYTCVCRVGYTGKSCSEDVDECSVLSSCKFGDCVNLVPGFRCDCHPGYAGATCTDIGSNCDVELCLNSGKCLLVNEEIVCFCDVGYSGERCEYEINECDSSPCSNNSTCIDLSGGYKCLCEEGYSGKSCELVLRNCQSNPCKNYGKCSEIVDGYSCDCINGYTGVNCEIEINECSSDPCENGGTCFNLIRRFYCSCVFPYKGDQCKLSPCDDPNPCFNGATCLANFNLSIAPLGFSCLCMAGYEGIQCSVNIDECRSNPCNIGHCIDGINRYQCLCPTGYKGPTCNLHVDYCEDNLCENGASCIDVGSGYTCQCLSGWKGEFCEHEMSLCEQDEPCKNGGTCVPLRSTYTCICNIGFTGENCSVNTDECVSNPCMNGGSCFDVVNNYTCLCLPLFTGRHCNEKFDPCHSNAEYCQNDGLCTVLNNGTITCDCLLGFNGLFCEKDIDECLSNPCQNQGKCWDGIAGYLCHCRQGYGGRHCEVEVQFCDSAPCINGGTCLDAEFFLCKCTESFQGETCNEDIDECSIGPVCLNGATCVNTHGSYLCLCRRGFKGEQCEVEINECKSNPCQNNGTCVDHEGFFICECTIGFTGKQCHVNVDDCLGIQCSSHGTCFDLVSGYECLCFTGWTGKDCEIELDKCFSNPCENNGTCVGQEDRFECICHIGFTGELCRTKIFVCHDEDTKEDLCENGGMCIENSQLYNSCLCPPGVSGLYCEIDIDECFSQPCKHNSTCINTLASFFCNCSSKYYGKLCQYISSLCLPDPCLNGGQCIDLQSNFKCECQVGFYGKYCQNAFTACDSSPCKNNATCVTGKQGNNYTCVCPEGFYGYHCDSQSSCENYNILSNYTNIIITDFNVTNNSVAMEQNRTQINFSTISDISSRFSTLATEIEKQDESASNFTTIEAKKEKITYKIDNALPIKSSPVSPTNDELNFIITTSSILESFISTTSETQIEAPPTATIEITTTYQMYHLATTSKLENCTTRHDSSDEFSASTINQKPVKPVNIENNIKNTNQTFTTPELISIFRTIPTLFESHSTVYNDVTSFNRTTDFNNSLYGHNQTTLTHFSDYKLPVLTASSVQDNYVIQHTAKSVLNEERTDSTIKNITESSEIFTMNQCIFAIMCKNGGSCVELGKSNFFAPIRKSQKLIIF